MKRVAKPVFFIVLAVILAFTGIVFFGVHTQYGDFTNTIIRGVSDIRWGIDIRGGVDVTFTSPADYDATNEEVDAAKSIVETRLVANNITDYEVYVDYNSDKIIVRFPWQAEDDSFDPEAAGKELGATALLTFREGSEKSLSDGQTYEDLPLIISGSDVEKASAVYQLKSGNSKEYEYMVSLKLKDSGKDKFAEATKKLASSKGYISTYMDDKCISTATVKEEISGGEATISGGFTADEAKALADQINGGALPFKLETSSFSTISPTLGTGARDAMAIAGVIAMRPQILVLDEPTAGLDPVGRIEMFDLIAKLKETTVKTIIMVSHNMDEISEVANKIAVLEHGKLRFHGTPKELFKHAEELEEIGLDIPTAIKLKNELKARGVELSDDIVTANDFVEAVVKWREKR